MEATTILPPAAFASTVALSSPSPLPLPSVLPSPAMTQQDEQKRAFLAQLNKFMASNGRPVGKPPIMGYKELDLFNLFKEVVANGGYHEVVRNVGTWSKIWKRLSNFDPSITDSSYRLKKNYERYLLDYEYQSYPEHREQASLMQQKSFAMDDVEATTPPSTPRKKKVSPKPKQATPSSQPSSPINSSSSEEENDPEFTPSKRGHKRQKSDSDLSSNNGSSEEEKEQQSPRQRPKLQTFNTFTISLQEEDTDIESAVMLLQSLKYCNNAHSCVIEAVC